jgi:hypothetical protein
MSTVHWPAGHEPAGAAIHEVNSGRSVATPELVWAWLVRPDLWHTYYANVRDVRHLAGPWPEIGLGSHFSWVTFRAPVLLGDRLLGRRGSERQVVCGAGSI